MRYPSISRFFTLMIAAFLSIPLAGCGDSTEPKGPEMGSIEAYLQEHPEERQDDPDAFGNDVDEFATSE